MYQGISGAAAFSGSLFIGAKFTALKNSIQNFIAKHHASIETQAQSTTAGDSTNQTSSVLNDKTHEPIEITYYIGIRFTDSGDKDLSKENIRMQETSVLRVEVHDATYKAAFEGAVKVASDGQAEKEGLSLMNYFCAGDAPEWRENQGVEFENDSGISLELRKETSFVQFANDFEAAAKNHYQLNGNLNAFNGSQVMKDLRKKHDIYFDDNLYMLATMGGFSGMDVMIQVNEWGHFTFTYTIWDHYGAGTDDMNSSLPGLPSMYHLQHVSPQLGENYFNRYKPFVWNIKIIR